MMHRPEHGPGDPGERSRGIALVAVLWIIASLTILVLSFNASVRSHLDVSASELQIARAGAVIDAAVRFGTSKLLPRDRKQRWIADGRAYDITVVGSPVRIRIRDEKSFVDLNKATEALLAGLLARHLDNATKANSIAARIADWRDRDHETRPDGAEDDAYQRADETSGAGDQPFTSVFQVGSVLGISPELSASLRPHITVFSGSPAINVLTASREALLALPGIDQSTVSNILRLRTDPSAAIELVGTLQRWSTFVTIDSGPVFRLRIDIRDKKLVPAAAEVTLMLTPRGKRAFHILDWHEVRTEVR